MSDDNFLSGNQSLENANSLTPPIAVTSGVDDAPEISSCSENNEPKDSVELEVVVESNVDSQSKSDPSPNVLSGSDSEPKSIPSQQPENKEDNKKPSPKQSPLLELFAEDRYGKDAAGAAFFEQIAENKIGVIMDIDITKTLPSSKAIHAGQVNISHTSDFPESEAEEMSSAWIPCERTKRVLNSVISPSAELYPVEKEMITTPTIVVTENIEDPVKSMLDEVSQLGPQRKIIAVGSVTADTEGLKKLIESGSYHSAFNLTTQLLKSLTVGNTCIVPPSPDSFQLWFVRIALLVKLRKFSLAETESDTFGNLDNPDLYYEFYLNKYRTIKGCMVPFSLRLLLAEIPQYNGNHDLSLNKLHSIHYIVQKIKKNLNNGNAEDGSKRDLTESRRKESLNLWNWRECRVLYSILNCYLLQKDYVMAINIAQSLLEKDKTSATELYSALGRIYLQLGDVKSAEQCFNSAFSNPGMANQSIKYNEIINKALLAVALGETEKAHDLYKEALTFNPMDPLLINNLSVCLLYMGKLKESLSLLEQAIHAKPKAYLHDSIMFNISTLYELESSHCTAKKHALLKLVASFADDSFSVPSLKMPPTMKT